MVLIIIMLVVVFGFMTIAPYLIEEENKNFHNDTKKGSFYQQ